MIFVVVHHLGKVLATDLTRTGFITRFRLATGRRDT